ncbi:NlpC/P60 family protein [Streptomyces sp. B21-108]|uniref:NlpC/P60 family protein n=1 Tax=Streptomyces sp. B21-108 TaxID=3039419 RepID=UPI002FF0DBCF
MASGGIPGVAVALATAGGVLLYAGFQGQSPLAALQDITAGKTKALEPSTVSFTNDPSNIGQRGVVPAAWTGGDASAFGGRLLAAAMTHRAEKYSQTKRWQAGYSDCSSFVGKSLKDIGVTPPGGSVTGSYLAWSKLKTVSRDAIQPGDLLCGSGHIAIAMSSTMAIGQQNGRQNVRVDTIDNIMWGQSGWRPRRYVGSTSAGAGVAAT